MKYSEASLGRTFIIRLEHGDKIPDVIEEFAQTHMIESAIVSFIGGADKGSKVVAGPKEGGTENPGVIVENLLGVSESLGIGTLFLNEHKIPKLHMHSSFGRGRDTITGCTREGVEIWTYGEVVLLEIKNTTALRKTDPSTGFVLLNL
ncbi:MAG: DNA-binding protein [Desulfitobacterium hafniense]|nr:DNA-binding protein [Desulfitobacterium hafniense]